MLIWLFKFCLLYAIFPWSLALYLTILCFLVMHSDEESTFSQKLHFADFSIFISLNVSIQMSGVEFFIFEGKSPP